MQTVSGSKRKLSYSTGLPGEKNKISYKDFNKDISGEYEQALPGHIELNVATC